MYYILYILYIKLLYIFHNILTLVSSLPLYTWCRNPKKWECVFLQVLLARILWECNMGWRGQFLCLIIAVFSLDVFMLPGEASLKAGI